MPSEAPLSYRRSYEVWQVATFALTAVVGFCVIAFADPDVIGWPTYTGLTLLVLQGLLAAALTVRLLGARWRIAAPVLALVALVAMGHDLLPVAPMALIVLIIPLLWLVWEFDGLGFALSLSALAVLLVMLHDVGVPGASGPGWLQLLPVGLVGLALIVSAHQIAITLHRREEELMVRADQLHGHLSASEDRLLLLRGLLDTIDAVIVAYDDDGALIWDNAAAKRLVGRAGIDTDGQLVDELHMYAADRTTRLGVDEIPLARAHRGEEFDSELIWFGPPGDQVAHLLSSKQIYRADAQRYGYVIVGLEVTELLDSIRVREEFLTTVSHELRTPLTSIIGYHELMEDEIDPADAGLHKMLAVAQRNATVLLNRVGELLQASGSVEALVVERRPTHMDALLEGTLAPHHAAAATLGVRLEACVHKTLNAHVDPRCFEQVVDNLVSNALKHTPAGGTVQVNLGARGGTLRLCVTDTGSGMSASEQRHVFDRFYRTAAANDQALQGLGVGLSVVKSIVEAHAGTITVQSRQGLGTTFVVEIPDAVDPDDDGA